MADWAELFAEEETYVCLLCERTIHAGEGCHDELEEAAVAAGGDGVCDDCWCEWDALRSSSDWRAAFGESRDG